MTENTGNGTFVNQLNMTTEQFNRAINFFIIRFMWQDIRGRKKIEGGNLYSRLGIQRLRYGRVLDTGIIRYSQGEIASLAMETGLPAEVFTGGRRIVLPLPNGEESELITDDDWIDLLFARKQRIQAEEEEKDVAKKAYQDKENAICEKLKKAPQNIESTPEFYCLCQYIRTGKKILYPLTDNRVNVAYTRLKNLSFKDLDECSPSSLKRLLNLITQKQKLIEAIVTYKEAAQAGLKK